MIPNTTLKVGFCYLPKIRRNFDLIEKFKPLQMLIKTDGSNNNQQLLMQKRPKRPQVPKIRLIWVWYRAQKLNTVDCLIFMRLCPLLPFLSFRHFNASIQIKAIVSMYVKSYYHHLLWGKLCSRIHVTSWQGVKRLLSWELGLYFLTLWYKCSMRPNLVILSCAGKDKLDFAYGVINQLCNTR